MKKIAISLSIICIIFVGIFLMIVLYNDKVMVENKNVLEVVLMESEDAGIEYLNKIYFVGDSTTLHFSKAGIDKSHIFVPENLTLTLTSNINSVIVGNNLTIAQSIKQANAQIVVITLGVNGADNFTELKYKTYYSKLIIDIKENSPSTNIIVQSVFPVSKEFSETNNGISNSGIDRLNEWAKDIAVEYGLKYLDTQSILKDEFGAQKQEYSVHDGVHMNKEAYEAILYYIRTHAIE